MQSQLIGNHQHIYDAIFQHPIARNLQWRELKTMLTALSDTVQEEHNGNFKFERNGKTLTVHPPRRKDFSDVQELMKVRHFLEQSGNPAQSEVLADHHMVVIIDHREARVFASQLHGSTPRRIVPVDSQESHRHLHNTGDDSNGQLKPELKPYYDEIAKSLAGAASIVIFGSATGSSSAMEHLLSELKEHHPTLAGKVVLAQAVNAQHMSDDQLLALARASKAKVPA